MKTLVLLCLIAFPFSALAADHRQQFGVGAGLGVSLAAPYATSEFRDAVTTKLPKGGLWARWVPGSPEIGLELAYDYLALGKRDLTTHAVTLSFISRMKPDWIVHPFVSLGFGWSKSSNYFRSGDLTSAIAKVRLGADYDLNERTDLSFYLDNFSIFKNQANEPNAHILAPQIALTYYFGESASVVADAPASAAPATIPPTPPAVATTPSPAVAQPTTQETRPVAKKKQKQRKKKKAADTAEPTTDATP